MITINKLGTLVSCFMIASVAMAGSHKEITESVKKIKQNTINSRTNIEQSQNLISKSDEQTKEVDKSLRTLTEQKNLIDVSLSENKQGLDRIESQKNLASKYIKEEETLIQDEEKKMKELEKLIEQIKTNIEKRKEHISTYKNNQNSLEEDKKSWIQKSKDLIKLKEQVLAKEASFLEEKKRIQSEKKSLSSDRDRHQSDYNKNSNIEKNYDNMTRTHE